MGERRKIRWVTLRKVMVCLFFLFALSRFLSFYMPSVRSRPSSLLVFAEASSFVRLDDIDPSGWFYQAVLYNPTDTNITVTGLRWWYQALTPGTDFIDDTRNARCYDSRYFSNLPAVWVSANGDIAVWQYLNGTISVIVPAKEIIIAWIEVPTNSRNNAGIWLVYYVEACAGSQWISSPFYLSHSGHDKIDSTVFRGDFDLATDPNEERQNATKHTLQTAEWLFNEDRSVIANLSTRVRLIPVTSSRNTDGIDYATVNVTFPSGWSYVLGSAYNPYSENITFYSVNGKDRLKWDLEENVYRYSDNQSMAQNYIEFNVTAPYVPGIHNFTITSAITSLAELLTTLERQFIYAVVKTPPNATFTSNPATLLTGENVTFNATASYDLDGQIKSCFWDFGDGNTGTGNITTHSYLDNGTYTVTLTVTDNDGAEDTALDTILVQNRPPTAQFTESAETVDTDAVIYFNASDSYDLDGSIVSYFWNFDDGTNTTGMLVNHTYIDNGNYTVTLTVTDDDGATASVNTTKTVLNRSPIASFSESATTVYTGETIYFNASDSYDPDGFIVTYSWDFGDGTNTTNIIVSHAYVEDGNYTVRLIVTDDDGASTITTNVETILNRAPVALFVIVPQQSIPDEIIMFNASASYDLDGNILTYMWNFGDGNITTTTSSTVIHSYRTFGNYSVTLNITDNDSFYNSSTLTLTIHNVDVAILDVIASTNEVDLGQTVNISVVVRNEGTINVTFDVIIYANSTIIETRTVQDLQPNETRNLNFSWGTSSLTETGRYVVRAEIGEVQGETDVADNINETMNIEVYSSSSNIWDILNSHKMPISIGVILLLSAIAGTILIKRNKHTATPKTLPPKEPGIFDTLANKVIPDAYSVMIVGDAGSGKSVLCQQLVSTYLKQGKPCIYVSYDCFPNEIRENMKSLGLDTSRYEQDETFLFLDCYSSIAGVTSQEKNNVEKPFELSELGIAMSIAMKDTRQKPNRIFLDSTVPLLTRLNAAKVAEFLQDRIAKIKGENGVFFFTIGKGTVEPGLTRRLEELVDCIIEIDGHEKKVETDRRIRVKKLRGRIFHHEWVSFKIEKKGFTISDKVE